MGRKIVGALAAAALGGTLVVWAPWAAHAGARASYEPMLNPAEFSTTIDNPYFPLPVGRQLVYKGVKDGQSQVDTVTVTNRTRLTAEGITARVVTDVAKHGTTLLEKTEDWYAQDNAGNVWYLGEKTAAYDNGQVDRSGSWESGVHDAEPGIVMEAHPKVPDAYRQEYSPRDEAQDTAWIVDTDATQRVPYGVFHQALVSLEASVVEPGAYDKKVYGKGVGIIYEEALTGESEIAKLVSVSG
ncbi:MAG: hypothetical protein ACJ735_04450 [Actinomycetes bacterium]